MSVRLSIYAVNPADEGDEEHVADFVAPAVPPVGRVIWLTRTLADGSQQTVQFEVVDVQERFVLGQYALPAHTCLVFVRKLMEC